VEYISLDYCWFCVY